MINEVTYSSMHTQSHDYNIDYRVIMASDNLGCKFAVLLQDNGVLTPSV